MTFDPVTALFDVGGKLIDKLIPDPAAKAEAMYNLAKLKQDGDLAILAASTDLAKGQLAINQVEASSSSLFVAGWRPAVGWVCAAAFAYASVIEPFITWVAKVLFKYAGSFPVLDTNITMQVLFAMIGMGALRSYDKMKGTA